MSCSRLHSTCNSKQKESHLHEVKLSSSQVLFFKSLRKKSLVNSWNRFDDCGQNTCVLGLMFLTWIIYFYFMPLRLKTMASFNFFFFFALLGQSQSFWQQLTGPQRWWHRLEPGSLSSSFCVWDSSSKSAARSQYNELLFSNLLEKENNPWVLHVSKTHLSANNTDKYFREECSCIEVVSLVNYLLTAVPLYCSNLSYSKRELNTADLGLMGGSLKKYLTDLNSFPDVAITEENLKPTSLYLWEKCHYEVSTFCQWTV